MANLRLSFSQISKYSICSRSYKYYYVDKIRPRVQSAALVFGSALDKGLNAILMPKQYKQTAEEIFEQSFEQADINGVSTYIPRATQIVYANADFDIDLLDKNDYEKLDILIATGVLFIQESSYKDEMTRLKKYKSDSGFDNFTDNEKQFYNLMNWLSLRQKGLLMLQAYRDKIMPSIIKVHEIQKYVSITNNDGDSLIGYIDLIADIQGHGNVILDNKTSAMDYEKDSVLTSPQLALYTSIAGKEYNTRKAGYLVLRKGIIKNKTKVCQKCNKDGTGQRHKTCDALIDGKRCDGVWTETIKPEVDVQIIINEIPEQTENIVLENLDDINHGIKQEVFHRNFHSCANTYGSPCPYINLCFKNKMDGLE